MLNTIKQQGKTARLTTGSVGKTLFHQTVPMFFGILSMVGFNIVDTYFVGELGTVALAAMSFTLPVVFIISSIALGIGIGTSAVISRAIGSGDMTYVRRLATDSILLGWLFVIVFIIIGMFTIEPLFRLLGASNEIIPHIKRYMYIWYPGMIFVVVPMVGNNIIRGTGDMKVPGLIMLIASVLNVIFDPIFIFGWWIFPRMEIAGAALATVLSRMFTLIASFYVLIKREKILTFKKTHISNVLQSFKKILFIGIPAAGTRIVMPLSIGIITAILSPYGKEIVAGFGVGLRIEFFALSIPMSLATVINPFTGQNWMSGNYDRVFKGIKLSSVFIFLYGLFIMALLFLTGKIIAPVFNNDPKVVKTIDLFLKIVPICYGLQGIHMLCGTALYSLHKPIHSIVLTIIQMFVFYVPFALIGKYFFQIKGVFFGIAISNVLAGILSYFVLRKIMFGMRKSIKE